MRSSNVSFHNKNSSFCDGHQCFGGVGLRLFPHSAFLMVNSKVDFRSPACFWNILFRQIPAHKLEFRINSAKCYSIHVLSHPAANFPCLWKVIILFFSEIFVKKCFIAELWQNMFHTARTCLFTLLFLFGLGSHNIWEPREGHAPYMCQAWL